MSAPEERAASEPEGRWQDHRVLAAVLAVAILLAPIACSIATTVALRYLVTEPTHLVGVLLWWLGLLAVATGVFFVVERIARRAIPLTVLLKMGLVFPGRAPKRLAMARRAGSVRDLTRRLEEARTKGVTDEPSLAAEKIVALAVSLGAHDRVTRGHAERVRAYTDLIADEMHLSRERRERLRWSALLHDIGKLTVHPEVLNKPGSLSDEEWEVLRQHPLEGARITAPLAAWLGEWSQTIAEHHERYDGKGYPYGLAGREISTGGRIVAVADSYDVMTSVRAYKRPLSPAVARTELAACAGTQFDPEIVRLFLGVSLHRLRAAVPLTWLSSLPLGNVGVRLGSLGSAGGNAAAAALVAIPAVFALGVAGPVAHASRSLDNPPSTTTAVRSVTRTSATTPGSTRGRHRHGGGHTATGVEATTTTATTTTTSIGGGVPTTSQSGAPIADGLTGQNATTTLPAGVASGSTTTTSASGSSTTSLAAPSAGSITTSVAAGGVTTTIRSGSTTSTTAAGATTTTKPGSSSTTTTDTTTTTGSSSTTTTETTTTTVAATTTTAAVPPPAPPTGLSATGLCEIVVLVPEVTLSWTPSTTSTVTAYQVYRSTSGGAYSLLATVNGRASTGYSDTAVSSGTTYSYEVRSLAPSGSTSTGPVSATTPGFCL